MFQTRMFIADAAIRAGHLPAGTAKLSPRAIRMAVSTAKAVSMVMLRKVSTGSSVSAILNMGQLVPQTRVSRASSTSTLGETRSTTFGSGLVFFRRLQEAAVDAPRAIGQLHHRIEGGHRPPVGSDDMDLLRDLAVQGHDLAEVEHARAIDRLIALADHVHESLGRAEHAAVRGRGVTEGAVAVVAAEGVDLALDGVADGRAIGGRQVLRKNGCGETEDQSDQSEEGKGRRRPDGEHRLVHPEIRGSFMLLERPKQVQDGNFSSREKDLWPFCRAPAVASHRCLAACIRGPLSLGCAPLRRTPRRGRPATRP